MKLWSILLSLLISSQALAVESLSDKTFYQKVTNSKGLVLVDFSAEWCGACQMLKPIYEKVEKDYPKVRFYSVDTDKAPNSSSYFTIKYIPTLIMFKDGGTPTVVQTGAESEDELRSNIDKTVRELR